MSFGLLSSKEYESALKEDPLAPWTRLALPVPFFGKDVPSKSAEFAHPGKFVQESLYAFAGLLWESCYSG